ncbi:MAG TPA: hypothetical protein VGT41_02575, partial [Candidatus Babeliales bacterium]|nr:hypothetical protein [Candidatus Babeliales bacterium]
MMKHIKWHMIALLMIITPHIAHPARSLADSPEDLAQQARDQRSRQDALDTFSRAREEETEMRRRQAAVQEGDARAIEQTQATLAIPTQKKAKPKRVKTTEEDEKEQT